MIYKAPKSQKESGRKNNIIHDSLHRSNEKPLKKGIRYTSKIIF